MTIFYHRQVSSEVHTACDYFDSKSAGLGDDFFTELTELIENISQHPEKWPPLLKENSRRKAHLKRFPYVVVYEKRSDCLKILVVCHQARHPDYGNRRR